MTGQESLCAARIASDEPCACDRYPYCVCGREGLVTRFEIPPKYQSSEFWADKPKMTSDEAQAIEAWQTVERMDARIEELSRVLLHVEGSLLAYWTNIPQDELQRLLPLIRETLGDYEPRTDDA